MSRDVGWEKWPDVRPLLLLLHRLVMLALLGRRNLPDLRPSAPAIIPSF